jgi:hypothetical protein
MFGELINRRRRLTPLPAQWLWRSNRSLTDTNQSQFTPEFRSRVLAQLTALYKSLHNNSDANLNELILSVLSKPLP